MPPKPHYRLPGDVIYVVAADPEKRYVLERQLFRLGPGVLTFGSGDELLGAVRPDDLGCALVVPSPPVIDGIAVLDALRGAAPRLVPVVLLDPEQVGLAPEAHRAGAFDIALEPISPERLKEAVSTALAASRERIRESSRQGTPGERRD
jgi:two-component system nitrogen regulation response regulator GlnG